MTDISKDRVGALSDGVIAIAATILVLELKVPEDRSVSLSDFEHWILLFIGWIVSFVVIATMWFENHRQLRLARSWNPLMMVMTFLQLALISLIPFGSNLVMDEPNSLPAAIAFNAIMLANGLCIALTGLLLARQPSLHAAPKLSTPLAKRSVYLVFLFVAVTFVGVLGAYLHKPFVGVLLWLSIPVISLSRFSITDGIDTISRT